jgi:hypothetical protein
MQGEQYARARMIHHQGAAGDVSDAAFTPRTVSVLIEMRHVVIAKLRLALVGWLPGDQYFTCIRMQ